MEEVQTDTLSAYGKNQEGRDPTTNNEDTCTALLNGSDEVDDPLDLMDNCDNVSLGSNSDVWKGSDSEDDTLEGADNSSHKDVNTHKKNEGKTDKAVTGDNDDNNKTVEEGESGMEKSTEETRVEQSVGNPPVEAETDQADKEEKLPEKENAIDDPEKAENLGSNEKADTTVETPDEKQTEKIVDTENKPQEQEPENEKQPEKNPNLQEDNLQENESETIEEEKESETIEEEKQSETIEEEKEPTEEAGPQEQTPTAEETSKETEKESEDKPSDSNTTENDSMSVDEVITEDKDPLGDATQETSDPKATNRFNAGYDDDCQMDYDAADDDDFDPSLLCPEVSMAVDDNPVVTTNGGMPNDDSDSPLPYEPVFSTFVDEVTGAEISFNLTTEEQELRKRLYGGTGNPIQTTRIHCTACNVHLGSALEGQNNRFVHPLLKVLICKECYHFYTSGEFEKDEDGSELYCRWCGQGGQVLCCSKCEFVFCKRCIRTNFGRKKMFEIRDSASWDCFRCNQQQIMTQRVACYEFFEYVRREMQRAATLNTPEIWSKDHTRCCSQKKRALEGGAEGVPQAKRPKKKKSETDPDYNPLQDKPQESPGHPGVVAAVAPSASNVQVVGGQKRLMMPTKSNVQIVSRAVKPKDNDIEFVRQIPAPHVTIGQAPRPTYRTLLPSNLRPGLQPTLLRISAQGMPPPLVSTSGSRLLNSALQGRSVNTTSNMMKHEWFEKTVRAAARVNSHLSYTLTQLNKAQSQAASVEELAVVHNKLQEILSSSINSLIQIRKNLRTEFIAGIKTVRLPSKKVDSGDDDVIFVSAPSTPTPSTSTPLPSTSTPLPSTSTPLPSTSASSAASKDPLAEIPLIIIDRSAPTKIHGVTVKSVGTPERPVGGYLKVKSVKDLQNVPSECITIPDDSPTPPKKGTPPVPNPLMEVNCNGAPEMNPSKEVDPLAGTPGTGNVMDDVIVTATIDLSEVPSGSAEPSPTSTSKRDKTPSKKIDKLVFCMKDKPSLDVKRMMGVKVKLRNDNLEELQRKFSAGQTK